MALYKSTIIIISPLLLSNNIEFSKILVLSNWATCRHLGCGRKQETREEPERNALNIMTMVLVGARHNASILTLFRQNGIFILTFKSIRMMFVEGK
jgi:hypothetical protein